jgi:hypothetical protein
MQRKNLSSLKITVSEEIKKTAKNGNLKKKSVFE